jgi:hypothetical protein
MTMKARLLTIAVLLFAAGTTIASVNTSSDYRIKPIPQPENKFEEVVEIFLLAVDRGELVVFDNPIRRHMLDPVQVKYVYTFNDDDPTISVYSLLKQPLKIPGVDDCTAGGVEVILDIDGSIIDSSIHIPSN